MQVNGLSKLSKIADRFPEVSEKHIGKGIQRALVRLWGAEKKEAPVSTGFLRDAWNITVGRFEGKLTSNASYSAAVHEGTRPHFVSGTVLTPWAKRNGANPWAVSKSIAKHGTKANPFFSRAIANTEDAVGKEFQTAIDAILSEVTGYTD